MELSPAQRLRRLLRLQALYGLFATLHWSLAYFFLVRERGFTLGEALWVPVLVYVASATLLVVLPRFEYRRALRLGFVLRIAAIVPYAFWPSPLAIYGGSVLFGMAIVLFWVPYNIMYFEHRQRTNKAGISALYMVVAPFIDAIGAFTAGLIALHFGFTWLFATAATLGVVPLLVSLRLTPRSAAPVRLGERLRRLSGLRLIVFFDGIVQGVIWPAVPLATLFYITGPFRYASFFALLGLAGAAAAITVGRFSDRLGHRMGFLITFSFVAGLGNVLSAVAGSVYAWGIARGVARIGGTLFEPFKNTVLLDVANDVADLYVAREFVVNVGRALGVGVLAVFLHFGSLQLALLVPAALTFAYPVLLTVKGLYPEERRLILKPFRSIFRQ